MSFLHRLTHQHAGATREGVGSFSLCAPRLPRARCRVLFRPCLPGAGWHRVPESEAILDRMLDASTPEEAMAILRSHPGARITAV